MRIESSQIALSSQHAATRQHARHEQFTAGVFTDGFNADDAQISRQQRSQNPGNSSDFLQRVVGTAASSPGALRQALDDFSSSMSPTPSSDSPDGLQMLAQIQSLAGQPEPLDMGAAPPQDVLKMDLIRAAVQIFTGRSLPMVSMQDLTGATPETSDVTSTYAARADDAEANGANAEPSEPAFGLLYRRTDRIVERETTSFQASGVVHTADGKRIDIDVALTMDRELVSETSQELRAGVALEDPLVVNFSGTAAQLTQRRFEFDLTADGNDEQIHFVSGGSGFLALDRNGSGVIEDGSELFGPTTGQGFSELAAYDEDGNNFIDEADSVWSSLRIWEKNEAGADSLVALNDRGVGAIYLGSAATPFEVKGGDGELQGVVQRSGIYLREDGGAGTVQHLDLVM